jgi:hypothetical protein
LLRLVVPCRKMHGDDEEMKNLKFSCIDYALAKVLPRTIAGSIAHLNDRQVRSQNLFLGIVTSWSFFHDKERPLLLKEH